VTEHVPVRRSWACVSCGQPWPCRVARAELLDEYADCPAALGLYLGCAFVECCSELDEADAGELYRRFFGWLRWRRTPGPAGGIDVWKS